MTQGRFTLKSQKWLIDRVSELVGILPYYYNNFGEKIETSLDTKIKILSSIGIDLKENSLREWLDYFEKSESSNTAKPVYVVTYPIDLSFLPSLGKTNRLSIEISPFEQLGTSGESFSLQLESDQISKISLPDLPIGYYKLTLEPDTKVSESLLVVVPQSAYIRSKAKRWGIHVNLWSLRGFGIESSFAHLRVIGEYVKEKGGFLSLSPLHLNEPDNPYGVSPYSAITRQFRTPLYLSEPEIEEKNREFFEYKRVWTEKIERLRHKYSQNFINNDEELRRFRDYKSSLCPLIREDLELFAVFMLLRERYGKDWTQWDCKLKEPDFRTIREIYEANQRDVLFYEYLQWLIDSEIEELRKFELSFDLGFGSVSHSFDVWRHQEIYAHDAEYGAPPDDFTPLGQKWGFPPVIPFKLKEQAYIPFIKILKNNMKGSLIRIDHALGLFRAFWIPKGSSPNEGAYVKYPWQDLLGIICLESHLNKTEVVGEDLGTAEEWFREELTKRKIASWKVFYFEKEGNLFKDNSLYPENSLCSITTHDLPTFKAYWTIKDLSLRRELSLLNQANFEKLSTQRLEEKRQILELLEKKGLLEPSSESLSIDRVLLSLIEFLAKADSRYLLLYLEDLLLIEEQTNLPGTSSEVPNWRRKIPSTVDSISELDTLKAVEKILYLSGRVSS